MRITYKRFFNGPASDRCLARPFYERDTGTVLHRDIFWIGRQWCVTGFGIQVIDSKREMKFDIPASSIWDNKLMGYLLSEPWFDATDFAHALSVARARAEENPKMLLPPLTNER